MADAGCHLRASGSANTALVPGAGQRGLVAMVAAHAAVAGVIGDVPDPRISLRFPRLPPRAQYFCS